MLIVRPTTAPVAAFVIVFAPVFENAMGVAFVSVTVPVNDGLATTATVGALAVPPMEVLVDDPTEMTQFDAATSWLEPFVPTQDDVARVESIVPASLTVPVAMRLGRLSPALAVNLPDVVLPKSKVPLVVTPPSLRAPAVAEVLPPNCPDDMVNPLPEPAKT